MQVHQRAPMGKAAGTPAHHAQTADDAPIPSYATTTLHESSLTSEDKPGAKAAVLARALSLALHSLLPSCTTSCCAASASALKV